MQTPELIGAHIYTGGDLLSVFERAKNLGCGVFQIFTKSQRQWQAKPLSPDLIENFRRHISQYNIKTIFAHASYLVNLASPDTELWKKSIKALIEEILRCGALSIPYLVVHAGFSSGKDSSYGLNRLATAVKHVIEETEKVDVKILIENMAGQGSSLCSSFEELAELLSKTSAARVGLCLDTCHLFSAGYDLNNKLDDILKQIERTIGFDNIHLWHLNNSKERLNSRKDRHQHIHSGYIRREAFGSIIMAFPDTPGIIETPKEKGMDEKNLSILRSFIRRKG